MPVVLVLLLVAAGGVGVWYWSRRKTRAKLLLTELAEHERAIVARQVPLTRKLPSHLRGTFEGKINAFLDQVQFIGCNGLEVTEDMELSIAAQACLLVVNTDTWYDGLCTVLIYPGAFKSLQEVQDGYVVTESEIVRTGESWSQGPVVLSWQHAQQDAINETAGQNVVFHEFAHQIDALSGETDGIPQLGAGQTLADWRDVFGEAYARHVHHTETGRATVFDPYGADAPEEFFAVAVEIFFERPAALERREPAVYAQLRLLFRLDPSSWA